MEYQYLDAVGVACSLNAGATTGIARRSSANLHTSPRQAQSDKHLDKALLALGLHHRRHRRPPLMMHEPHGQCRRRRQHELRVGHRQINYRPKRPAPATPVDFRPIVVANQLKTMQVVLLVCDGLDERMCRRQHCWATNSRKLARATSTTSSRHNNGATHTKGPRALSRSDQFTEPRNLHCEARGGHNQPKHTIRA